LYQTCPSGNLYEFYASAIGARSQSARTYLEKHYATFAAATTDELIGHALQALVGCVSGDDELTADNGSIAVVGIDQKFRLLEGADLQPYLDQLAAMTAMSGPGDATQDDDDDEEEKADEPQNAPEAMET
jgi:20S proteasome subunit alpha 6